MSIAKKVVNEMIVNDEFSKWLGIKVLVVNKGNCVLQMKVRKEMTNGFNIAHGGITYALADSALAFAANTCGIKSVSIETSISHTKKVLAGDVLSCYTKEINRSKKTAIYYVIIKNQDDSEVAHFKGTVFITDKKWFKN